MCPRFPCRSPVPQKTIWSPQKRKTNKKHPKGKFQEKKKKKKTNDTRKENFREEKKKKGEKPTGPPFSSHHPRGPGRRWAPGPRSRASWSWPPPRRRSAPAAATAAASSSPWPGQHGGRRAAPLGFSPRGPRLRDWELSLSCFGRSFLLGGEAPLHLVKPPGKNKHMVSSDRLLFETNKTRTRQTKKYAQ